MTPKEKAKELFDKMFEPNNHYMNKNIEIDKIIYFYLTSPNHTISNEQFPLVKIQEIVGFFLHFF